LLKHGDDFMKVLAAVMVFFIQSQLICGEEIGIPSFNKSDPGVVNLLEDGLEDWKAEDGKGIDNWIVRNRILTNYKHGSHLVTKKKYRDFDLSLEFLLPHKGNSGVYLRGRYEVQLDDHNTTDQIKSTGAIWGKIPIESHVYNGPNRWNQLSIRIRNNSVTVLVNRNPVIRSKELKGTTRGAIDENESAPGPILLQSLKGARFKNILIKEL